MKRNLLLPIALLIVYNSFSQGVGIGTATPDVSAALDVTSITKGLLIPRMTTASMFAIVSPAKGLMIYDTQTNQLKVNIGTPAIPNWQPVASAAGNAWSLTGNGGVDPTTQFVGTTDNQPLRFRINNIQAGELHPSTGNVFFGIRAGEGNTSGFSNVAIGKDALKFNATIGNLIAIGDSALFNNTGTDNGTHIGVGLSNVAIGHQALFNNTTGQFNLAIGEQSLFTNTTGPINIAIGFQSLFSNTTGNSNTAIGHQALFSNTTGSHNTATGFLSLQKNIIGDNNTATGWQSLHSNTSGDANTAFGTTALFNNTIGTSNTAVGNGALTNSTTGSNNTAVGAASLASINTGNNNTAIGNTSLNANTTGSFNTATGHQSLLRNTMGESNTANGSFSLNANTIGIGNTAVGSSSLFANTTGSVNTAVGDLALGNNTIGRNNTATGVQTLFLNITGSSNTAVGNNALSASTEASNNTVVGFNAAFTFNLGSDNTIIGTGADATADGITNSIAIGKDARATASNQVRFGNASTTSIGGIVGFTNLSDGRYKKNVKEDVKGIDFIMKLRPVTYQLDMAGINDKLKTGAGNKTNDVLKKGTDENGKTIHSGFVAQEVEQAAKDAAYNFSGIDKPKNENDMYGLRYADFVVPIIKAVQEQQQMIKELKKENEELKNRMLFQEKK